jgi:hypothetical protein
MPASLSNLLSTINTASGFARPNRFQVFIPTTTLTSASTTISDAIKAWSEFPDTDGTDWMGMELFSVPNSMSTGNMDIIRLSAFCEKTQLPGYQFQTDVQRIYGPGFKFPHMPEWSDITMTFFCGADMKEKFFFDAWMNMVMDPISNNFNYRTEYACNIFIDQYDVLDTVQYEITLWGAYPISVSPISLSYEETNTVMSMEVTFNYQFARTIRSTSAASGTPVMNTQVFNQTVTQKAGVNFGPDGAA